jgi:hypothetical protein
MSLRGVQIQRLIRERVPVDHRHLAGPDMPLEDLAPTTESTR